MAIAGFYAAGDRPLPTNLHTEDTWTLEMAGDVPGAEPTNAPAAKRAANVWRKLHDHLKSVDSAMWKYMALSSNGLSFSVYDTMPLCLLTVRVSRQWDWAKLHFLSFSWCCPFYTETTDDKVKFTLSLHYSLYSEFHGCQIGPVGIRHTVKPR